MSNIREAISRKEVMRKAISKKEFAKQPVWKEPVPKEKQGVASLQQIKATETIHILDKGETQIIGKQKRSKASSSSLKSLKNVVENVISKRPSNVELNPDSEFRAINIVVGKSATFFPKGRGEGRKPFMVKYSDLNQDYVKALIGEMPVTDLASENPMERRKQGLDGIAKEGLTERAKAGLDETAGETPQKEVPKIVINGGDAQGEQKTPN